jgi:hypothetical protein
MYAFKAISPKSLRLYDLPGRALNLMTLWVHRHNFCVPKADKLFRFFGDVFKGQSGVVDANAITRIEGCKAFATETFRSV